MYKMGVGFGIWRLVSLLKIVSFVPGILACKPIPSKFSGVQIHPLNLNLGGGVSKTPCFTVFSLRAAPEI